MHFNPVLVFLLLLCSASAIAQTEKNSEAKAETGLKHGRIVGYQDEERKIRQYKGRYRRGNPVGIWKYYDSEGRKHQKDVYRGLKIKTKRYHANGKVRSKGIGFMDLGEKLEYYYQGIWKYYTEDGRLQKTVRYERGEDVEETVFLEPVYD